jgi:hypothetical protein
MIAKDVYANLVLYSYNVFLPVPRISGYAVLWSCKIQYTLYPTQTPLLLRSDTICEPPMHLFQQHIDHDCSRFLNWMNTVQASKVFIRGEAVFDLPVLEGAGQRRSE